MLVLSRRKYETLHIGDDIVIRILEISLGRVRIGIEAPKTVEVYRGEIMDSILDARKLKKELEDASSLETKGPSDSEG